MKRIRQFEEKTVSLVEFAENHGLDMILETLFARRHAKPHFLAHLDGVAEEDSGHEFYGDGATEEEAIVSYAWEISFKTVVIKRRFKAPVIVRLPRVVYFPE